MYSSRPFLLLVANDLVNRFGNDLSKIVVVFPGRRARLFFNNYLSECSDEPVWAPGYYSIEELFQQVSDLQIVDNIKLIGELYKTYIQVYNSKSATPSSETLDEFYFFGESLLNDFDDVDKNLVNAHSLFSNLQDLDQLRDDFEHLNETQIEALSRHFNYVFQGKSSLKTSFWSVWNVLGEVYSTFKQKLKAENSAYQGMLTRSVVEDEFAEFNAVHYVFVGFNVLTKCEEKLFRRLRNKALFYWDYDTYYMDVKDEASTTEAGRYIKKNIEKFGSALSLDIFGKSFRRERKITMIASSSESGQASYLPYWIDSLNRLPQFSEPDTAIVLCNEQMLPVVIHSIPAEKVENVNITMGFPLMQTPVCGFLQVLTEMQIKGISDSGRSFRYKYVLPVLRHPCVQMIFPESKSIEQVLIQGNVFFPTIEVLKNESIFSYASTTVELAKYLLSLIERLGQFYENQSETSDVYSGLYKESVFRAYQVVNRLCGLLQSGELNVERATFSRLMRKLLTSTTVPFHGEPVKGLQVMGVLETRALDFKNVIMLSVNEGFMPGTTNDDTFIPQFLRRYFELSTIEHQDAIYAYYFYRLIQRAENVTFVYNTDKTQTGKSEMSRFLLQLLVNSGLEINRYSLQSAIKPIENHPIVVPKTKELSDRIRNRFDLNINPGAQKLSPSAFNVFIDCSLRFYLQYIENLREKEELSNEMDVSIFGTIFHRSAELLYREIGRVGEGIEEFEPFFIHKEHLDIYLKNPQLIDKLVSKAFSEEYFKTKEISPKQYNGEQLINFRIICHLMKRMIEFDRKQTPFLICGLEKKVSAIFELPESGISVKIGGVIDRLEQKNETLYIVDYKTGGNSKPFKTIPELATQKITRASHVFQTFLYASVLINNKITKPVVPCLLYLQNAGKDDYSSVIQYEKENINDFNLLYPDFLAVVKNKLAELFDQDIPFSQTTILSKCNYCEFKKLCNR